MQNLGRNQRVGDALHALGRAAVLCVENQYEPLHNNHGALVHPLPKVDDRQDIQEQDDVDVHVLVLELSCGKLIRKFILINGKRNLVAEIVDHDEQLVPEAAFAGKGDGSKQSADVDRQNYYREVARVVAVDQQHVHQKQQGRELGECIIESLPQRVSVLPSEFLRVKCERVVVELVLVAQPIIGDERVGGQNFRVELHLNV